MENLPDFSQGITAVALLTTLLAMMWYMLKREKDITSHTDAEREEAIRLRRQDAAEAREEIKRLNEVMREKRERDMETLQKGLDVVAEAQRLVRELLVTLAKRRENGS